MIEIFLKIPKKIRYILVGGFNTAFGFSLFSACYYFFGKKVPYQLILVVVHFLAVFVSFLTLKFFVFQTKGSLFRQYLKCNISYLFLLFLNLIILTFFVEYLKINVILSQFIVIIIMAVVGFFIHEQFSFGIKKHC